MSKLPARMLLAFAALFGISAASAIELPAQAIAIEQLAHRLGQVPPMERHRQLVDAYRQAHPRSVRQESLAELRAHFETANVTVFYANDRELAHELLALYRALESSGSATPDDLDLTAQALFKARAFDAANALLQAHPGKQAPVTLVRPQPVAAHAPAVMRVEADGQLSLHPADAAVLENGVVIIAHPLCHFSQAASAAILADPQLHDALRTALWLVPTEGNLHLGQIRDWNANHPEQAMQLTYDWLAWDMIPGWSTPNFYFFHDGQLLTRVQGWPTDGSRKDELLAAVKTWQAASSH